MYQLHCSEIWGGNENVDCDVCTAGITASIHSSACGFFRGGDIYYVTVCSSNSLTRIILADLRGHGKQVFELSNWIYEALREQMESLDGSSILTSLNKKLFSYGFNAITTAVVVSFYVPNSTLYFSYAGHPPALFKENSDRRWKPLLSASILQRANLPLGVIIDTAYDQDCIRFSPGDRLAIYTDGISESLSKAGLELGDDQLCNLLEAAAAKDLSTTKHNLIRALHQYTGNVECQDDDRTLLLIEINDSNLGCPVTLP